jgi:hypothetical protein
MDTKDKVIYKKRKIKGLEKWPVFKNALDGPGFNPGQIRYRRRFDRAIDRRAVLMFDLYDLSDGRSDRETVWSPTVDGVGLGQGWRRLCDERHKKGPSDDESEGPGRWGKRGG